MREFTKLLIRPVWKTIIAVSLLAFSSISLAATPAQKCSLNILLTNDDGWNAPGIQVLFKSLEQMGHKVTLVASETQQSGRGGAISTQIGQEMKVIEQDTNVWSVASTPADSVKAALGIIMLDNPPDLTVSGANFGSNLGKQTVHNSGTLGAALTAHYANVPAIAISVGILPQERKTTPAFISTHEAFGTSGKVLNQFLNLLIEKNGCKQFLPNDAALSINVPVPISTITGISYAPLSSHNLFDLYWHREQSDGSARIAYKKVDTEKLDKDDDVNLFLNGKITVSLISGDFSPGLTKTRAALPNLSD